MEMGKVFGILDPAVADADIAEDTLEDAVPLSKDSVDFKFVLRGSWPFMFRIAWKVMPLTVLHSGVHFGEDANQLKLRIGCFQNLHGGQNRPLIDRRPVRAIVMIQPYVKLAETWEMGGER